MTQSAENGDRAGGSAARDRKDSDAQAAWERYMASCTDYIKRQFIVYQNWPQRKYDATGYRKEKVFTDMNN